MIAYKAKWSEGGNGEWKYQDADLESRYAEFVRTRRADDGGYKADEEAYRVALDEYNQNKKEQGEETIEMHAIN